MKKDKTVKVEMAKEKDTVHSGSVAMRDYYSSNHLWAARHFARLAADIEKAHTGTSKFDKTHRSYVTGSILATVGFLEAVINELFQDVADRHDSYIEPLDARCTEQLAGLWETSEGSSVADWSTLDKYQTALLCCGKEIFDKGKAPYQDARVVIRLRNTLVHFCPKTQRGDYLSKLSEALKSKGFPSSRLMSGSGNPYFPDHCLGAGCANWAVEAVYKFTDDFFERIGVQPHYQQASFPSP